MYIRNCSHRIARDFHRQSGNFFESDMLEHVLQRPTNENVQILHWLRQLQGFLGVVLFPKVADFIHLQNLLAAIR